MIFFQCCVVVARGFAPNRTVMIFMLESWQTRLLMIENHLEKFNSFQFEINQNIVGDGLKPLTPT